MNKAKGYFSWRLGFAKRSMRGKKKKKTTERPKRKAGRYMLLWSALLSWDPALSFADVFHGNEKRSSFFVHEKQKKCCNFYV